MTNLRPLRRRMLEIAAKAGEGHLPSSYSVLELIWTLHNRVMGADDRFVLSKGHAALALYVVLNEMGIIPDEALNEFCQLGAKLLGHPERNPAWKIEATTGSLGHGGPMSVGLAYGKRLKGEVGRVYCLLGDQECNEGSVWEAALLASQHKLVNLSWILDDNGSAEDSLSMDSIGAKFMAFGWHVETCSGHSIPMIEKALASPSQRRPTCLIASTVKGFGITAMQDDPRKYHHYVPKGTEFEMMLASLA